MDNGVISIAEFRSHLSARGTALNAGIVIHDVNNIMLNANFKLPSEFIGMYQSFNGFPPGVTDGGSGIRIWPLSEVLIQENLGNLPSLPFADLLMGSSEIAVDLSSADNTIMYADTAEKLAPCLNDFLGMLTRGDLDFI